MGLRRIVIECGGVDNLRAILSGAWSLVN